MKRLNKLVVTAIIMAAFAMGISVLIALGSHWIINTSTEEDVFNAPNDLPEDYVGLVLGCRRYLSNGRQNLYFKYRIDQAAKLHVSGKIHQIIVSGDNSRVDYDEPSDMKLALMEKGVPTEAIHLDYAGFSTLDSVVRAKEVFQQTRLIVISQEFHVRRAVYIGKAHDLDIVGSIATDVSGRYGLKTRVREYLARVKTLLDIHIWNRSPKFLGEPINLG